MTFLGKHKAETRQEAIDEADKIALEEAAKKIEKTKARYFSRKKKDTNR